jgi:hypothetical protein
MDFVFFHADGVALVSPAVSNFLLLKLTALPLRAGCGVQMLKRLALRGQKRF